MAVASRERIRLSAGERRQEVLRAAGRLFGERGYAATRLEDIAAAANVTKPVVYRHFPSKKALYLGLLTQHEDDLPTFFEGTGDGSAEPTVRAIAEHWLDYVRENRHAWLMLFRDSSGDEEIKARRSEVSVRARQVLAGFVAGFGDGLLPHEQVEPTAEFLTSGLAGLALWWIDHPETPKPVILDVVLRMSAPALLNDAPAGG